jgi:ion channel-forming bestrophin family protein
MSDHFVGPNYVPGLGVVDPFTTHASSLEGMANAILATALFRCWHILIFYTLWATAITLISKNVHDLSINPTLLTVYVNVHTRSVHLPLNHIS